MQMWTESQRRWRKKGRRGVSPIIATILLVAITVVLAAVLYILISGLTKGPGNTPLGTALAMGTPSAGVNGSAFTYTVTITPSSGLTPAGLNFQVQSSTAAILAQPASSIIQVIGPQGCLVATYTFSTNVWAAGSAGAGNTHACAPVGTANTVLTSGMQLNLQTAANLAGQGDTLVAVGSGSFSGTVPIALP
ncbi:MAG TPA: archaellin/type IV pilin N-terminal domain-containing protein [Thermoplasmata archaeon]|nr:archaellin/type IV pilin N-terminal domain-containing protein [Thermoplasmata archaeon]